MVTIYGWFNHEYDFVIGCSVETSVLMICHVDRNVRVVDKPQPFPIDRERLEDIFRFLMTTQEMTKTKIWILSHFETFG